MNARILVVEDEKAIQLALSGLLRREGYDVEVAGTGEDALALLRDATFDLVITDLALGRGITGMDVLRAAKELRAETLVVMITAHGSEAIAVEAMKAGAEDYVPKPFDNDEIRLVVHRALDRTRLERENRLLLEQVQRQYGFENLIGSGPAMRHVFETLQKVAETDLTVPVPLSPRTSTVMSVSATFWIVSNTFCIAGPEPIRFSKPYWRWTWSSSSRFSRSRRVRSSARCTTRRISSLSKGFGT